MIRHELTSSTLRFYEVESDNPFQQYDAICTLIWEAKDIIWIKGLHGILSRKLLRELVKFFVDNSIITVKAHRADGHSIPFMSKIDDHMELSVSDVKTKLRLV